MTLLAGLIVMAKVFEKPPELIAHTSVFGSDDERVHVREYSQLNQYSSCRLDLADMVLNAGNNENITFLTVK